jgi:hypothetical protein
MEDSQGFQHVMFGDSYNRMCVVGQSSLAEYEPPGSSALWIGTVGTLAGNQKSAMHLKTKEVKALVAVLEMWLQAGRLAE